MNLDADNLNIRLNESQEVVVEPSYIEYLREHGFTIESVEDSRTVESGSSETDHVIHEIVTYEYPKDHPQLDYAVHETTVRICDCWSWRNNSNDVAEGEKPGGTCKHVEAEFMTEKAKADNQQTEL